MPLKRTALASLSIVATLFALLLGLAAPASAAPGDCAPDYPPAQCTIQLSRTVVPAGGQLSFSASGFAANETVVATIHSTPVQVGTFTADSAGNVSGTVTIPSSVDPGRHTLVLVGQRSGIVENVPFTVAAAAAVGAPGHNKVPSQLAFTGAQVAGAAGAGVALIGGGALLLVFARRRRDSAPLGA